MGGDCNRRLGDRSTNVTSSESDQFYIPAYFDHQFLDLERIVVPLICIFGLHGNAIIFVIFRHKSLHNHAYSLILRARSLSDSGFLFTLLTIWSSDVFQLKLSYRTGICQAIIFLLDVFSCISVWLIVFLSFLMLVRVRPHAKHTSTMGRVTNTRMALILLVVCVVCCYNFPLWTLEKHCRPCNTHFKFLKVMVYADSVITLCIPFILVTTSLFVFVYLLRKSESPTNFQDCDSQTEFGSSGKIQRLDCITKMLVVVCALYYFTSLPFYIIHLRLIILTYDEGEFVLKNKTEITMQTVTKVLYYLSFSINIIVICAVCPEFRNRFIERLCEHCHKGFYRKFLETRSENSKDECNSSTTQGQSFGPKISTSSCQCEYSRIQDSINDISAAESSRTQKCDSANKQNCLTVTGITFEPVSLSNGTETCELIDVVETNAPNSQNDKGIRKPNSTRECEHANKHIGLAEFISASDDSITQELVAKVNTIKPIMKSELSIDQKDIIGVKAKRIKGKYGVTKEIADKDNTCEPNKKFEHSHSVRVMDTLQTRYLNGKNTSVSASKCENCNYVDPTDIIFTDESDKACKYSSVEDWNIHDWPDGVKETIV